MAGVQTTVYGMQCTVDEQGRVQHFDAKGSVGTTHTAHNRFMMSNYSESETFRCAPAGTAHNATPTIVGLQAVQASGWELGSTVEPIPSNDAIIRIARSTLLAHGWPPFPPPLHPHE